MIITCWTVVSRPRMLAGATSEMYSGESTDAAPTAMPAEKRAMMKIRWVSVRPWTSAPSRNSTAAMIITMRRPIASASRPARNAPTAQPISSEPTVRPSHQASRWNVAVNPLWVPLTAPLS